MLLIADSGSTKCDWMLINKAEQKTAFSTMGFNPFFHNDTLISSELFKSELYQYADEVKFVFFFGAGCSSKEMKQIVERGLQTVFTKAVIYVDHDLVASAFATYDGHPCISCILGTGSNSSYFDGDVISEEIPALGYILGDEGSGSYYGKKVLQLFLYKKLPKNLQEDFHNIYKINKNDIFENTYRKPNANVYLASFMDFVSNHRTDPFIREMIHCGMKDFMQTHIMCFKLYKEVPANFIGSIAYYFEDILRETASELGIVVGTVIQRPIDGLVNYYLKYHHEKLLI